MTVILRLVLFIVLLIAPGCGEHYVEPAPPPQPPHLHITPNDPRGVWLAVYPSQCSTHDAWRKDWVAAHDGAKYHPFGPQEMPILIEYCSKLGVGVLDSTTRNEYGTRCLACTCRANYILFLLVDEADAGVVIDLGGTPMRPDR